MTASVLQQLVEQGYDPVLSLQQAEVLIGLDQRTLRRLADEDAIKILRLSSRRCGIRRSEIERFLSSRETADDTRETQARPGSRKGRAQPSAAKDQAEPGAA